MQPMLKAGMQVVGFGPAAMGLVIAADRMGILKRLLQIGIVFLERSTTRAAARTTRFPWKILSNSPARDFVAGISKTGAFASLLTSATARPFQRSPDEPVWLPHVGALMNDLGDQVEQLLDSHPGLSCVRYGATVASVKRERDGTFTSYDADGQALVHSDYVILAAGAEERINGVQPSDALAIPVIRSGDVLCGQLEAVGSCLARQLPVLIVGASHSAFSVARMVLDHLGDRVNDGQLRITYRSMPALHFDSTDEARAAGHDPDPADISLESGEVNRFHGLRGRARELFVLARAQKERRILLLEGGVAAAPDRSLPGLAVSAIGYAPRRIGFHGDDSNLSMASVPSNLDGVFGIGIGHPGVDAAQHAAVGINLFHGPDAERIIRAVLEGASSRELLACGRREPSVSQTWSQ